MIFTSYGLLASLSLGLLLAAADLWYRREKISVHVWLQLCIAAIPLALVGSRLLFSVSAIINGDFSAPVQALYAWDGGASITGAFIGVVLAAVIISKLNRIPCGKLLDGVALGAPVALVVERLAEFPVDMGIGRPVDTEFLYFLGHFTDDRHPVFLYEAVIALILLVVLGFIALSKQKRRPGDLLLIFMTLYGTTQVLMESLRDDAHMVIYYIRLNQVAALVMAVIAFVIWMIRWARSGAKPVSLAVASGLVTGGIALGIFQEFAVDSNPNLLLEYAIMALALALIAAVSLTVRTKAD